MRTRSRRLLRNRKGGAEVAIAIILAMVVAVSYVHNILIWGQFLNDEDRNRLNEKIEIEVVRFDVKTNKLVVDVRNTGSVTAHIVAIYLYNATKVSRYNIMEGVDSYLEPGESKDVWPGYPNYTYPELGEDNLTLMDTFVVSVVTERGNLASRTYVYETFLEYNPEVGELGVFRTKWFYSKYSSVETGGNQADAVIINKTDTYVAFYLNVTNTWDRPCGIRNGSLLALNSLQPSVQPIFYIVEIVEYPSKDIIPFPFREDKKRYNFYIVKPEETVMLVFAASSKGGSDWRWSKTYPFGEEAKKKSEASGILISLFFDVYMEDDSGELVPVPDVPSFGQTINTQATLLTGQIS